MATIVPTAGFRTRYQSLTFTVTNTSASDIVANAWLQTTSGLSVLTPTQGTAAGGLLTFLQTVYANAAAAEAAWVALGGQITWRQIGGTAAPAVPVIGWSCTAAVPDLGIVVAGGASNEQWAVVIAVRHSIIQ